MDTYWLECKDGGIARAAELDLPSFFEDVRPVFMRRLREEGTLWCEPYSRRDLWYLNRRPNPCIVRLSQPNLIDHLKRPGQGRKNRLSHPNLHITPVKVTPQSQSSIESQDSGTYECTRSTTPCPPSYSPASQRSRYSQPNLPTLLISYDRRSGGSPDRRIRMSQPTLNSSLSGINSFNFVSMNRSSGGGRLSYTSLRATSGDNSINEEERLSTPNVHVLGGSGSPRGSLTMERSSSRLSQPDVRRFILRQDKRERLSQPTLVTGDYYPGRTQQRLSQPCLSSGTIGMHSPSPPPYPLKHKRFGPAFLQASQRDRLSQLDIGSKYRNIKDLSGGGGGGGGGGNNAANVKFNRDRFSIPELETQNDLRLMAGTPKQRFSLDSQLTKQRYSLDSQDSCKSRLLPIASSPIFEHQQMKTEELMGMSSDRLKSPTCEGLQSVIVASTSPIFPPGERRFLAPDFPFTGRKTSTPSKSPPKSEVIPFSKRSGKPPPIPVRERMSVPEIRNSSLRRLLDPPARQRHSIAGNLRQSLFSPVKLPEFGTSSRKSPRYSIDDALEKLKRIEKEENRRNYETSERQEVKEQEEQRQRQQQQQEKEPKHIQRHYSYTYETPGSDDSGSASTLGKLSVGGTPKRKFLESNFDENEQVITTVIETEIPMILPSTPAKYAKKPQAYSCDTPKWIRKYLSLETESPKITQRKTSAPGQILRSNSRRNSRRKSSLESIETVTKKPEEKARSKSASCEERSMAEQKGGVRETYVRIVPSNNAQQENRYEVGVETAGTWTKTDGRGFYGDDTDTDDSTSI